MTFKKGDKVRNTKKFAVDEQDIPRGTEFVVVDTDYRFDGKFSITLKDNKGETFNAGHLAEHLELVKPKKEADEAIKKYTQAIGGLGIHSPAHTDNSLRPPPTDERIASALERIAAALEDAKDA